MQAFPLLSLVEICFFALLALILISVTHCLKVRGTSEIFKLIWYFSRFAVSLSHPRGEILGSRMRFLLYPNTIKSPNFTRKDKDKDTSILFLYMIVCVQPTLYLVKVYKQRGVFVLLFISFMVFGDTNRMMSVTSPYAFLVSVTKHITADFGGLIGNTMDFKFNINL